MARKTFDELVEEYAAEEKAAQNETEPVETPEVEPSVEDNHTEPTPEPEPAPVNEETKTEEPPKDEPKSDPVIDEIENTNATIRKRLEKQAKSYEQKLADKDAEWQKKFEEFKSQFEQKKPEVKTRDNFEHDEEYVAYLTQQQIDKDRAEQQRIKAEQDEEAAKKKAEEDAAAAEVKARQTRFVNNIEQCFDGEARETFMARLKYAHSKGFGELLDANPAASDYLLSSPKGPLVLAKLLDTSNPEYFRRVFPVGGINPLEQFSELKDIERTAVAERNGTVEAPAALKKPATIGRPGAQGSGGTGGNPMSDPKARLDYVRKVMGY